MSTADDDPIALWSSSPSADGWTCWITHGHTWIPDMKASSFPPCRGFIIWTHRTSRRSASWLHLYFDSCSLDSEWIDELHLIFPWPHFVLLNELLSTERPAGVQQEVKQTQQKNDSGRNKRNPVCWCRHVRMMDAEIIALGELLIQFDIHTHNNSGSSHSSSAQSKVTHKKKKRNTFEEIYFNYTATEKIRVEINESLPLRPIIMITEICVAVLL